MAYWWDIHHFIMQTKLGKITIFLAAFWCKHLLTNENLRKAGSNYAFENSRWLVPLPQIGSSQCFLYHVNGTRSLSFCSHYCKGIFWPFFSFFLLYPFSIYLPLPPLLLGNFFLLPDIQANTPTGKFGISFSFCCQNLKASPVYTDYWPFTSIPSSGAFKKIIFPSSSFSLVLGWVWSNVRGWRWSSSAGDSCPWGQAYCEGLLVFQTRQVFDALYLSVRSLIHLSLIHSESKIYQFI